MADILNTEENYNPKLGLKNIYAKLLEIIAKVNTLWSNAPTVTPKVYKALLTQTGTDAPVATVLVNTLSGTPVWSYFGVGRYRMTLVGQFLTGKVIFLLGNSDFSFSFAAYRVDDDTIEVNTGSFVPALQDSFLYETSILIEVYP